MSQQSGLEYFGFQSTVLTTPGLAQAQRQAKFILERPNPQIFEKLNGAGDRARPIKPMASNPVNGAMTQQPPGLQTAATLTSLTATKKVMPSKTNRLFWRRQSWRFSNSRGHFTFLLVASLWYRQENCQMELPMKQFLSLNYGDEDKGKMVDGMMWEATRT